MRYAPLVLLVEDDAGMRQCLRTTLTVERFRVVAFRVNQNDAPIIRMRHPFCQEPFCREQSRNGCSYNHRKQRDENLPRTPHDLPSYHTGSVLTLVR